MSRENNEDPKGPGFHNTSDPEVKHSLVKALSSIIRVFEF